MFGCLLSYQAGLEKNSSTLLPLVLKPATFFPSSPTAKTPSTLQRTQERTSFSQHLQSAQTWKGWSHADIDRGGANGGERKIDEESAIDVIGWMAQRKNWSRRNRGISSAYRDLACRQLPVHPRQPKYFDNRRHRLERNKTPAPPRCLLTKKSALDSRLSVDDLIHLLHPDGMDLLHRFALILRRAVSSTSS